MNDSLSSGVTFRSSNETVAPLTSSPCTPVVLRFTIVVRSDSRPSTYQVARVPRTSTATATSLPTPTWMGAAAVSVTFQVLAAVRWANSRPLVAVEPFRSVAIDHGTAPLGARSSPNATQRAPSSADSNRRWLSIRKSVSGLPKVMRLCWLALADVPISLPPWTFHVPSTADQPAATSYRRRSR